MGFPIECTGLEDGSLWESGVRREPSKANAKHAYPTSLMVKARKHLPCLASPRLLTKSHPNPSYTRSIGLRIVFRLQLVAWTHLIHINLDLTPTAPISPCHHPTSWLIVPISYKLTIVYEANIAKGHTPMVVLAKSVKSTKQHIIWPPIYMEVCLISLRPIIVGRHIVEGNS